MDTDVSASLAVPKVELLTRTGCHLCEDARAVLTRVTAELQLPWTETNIAGNPELTARFAEEVPVVLVDGVQRDFWHIDPVRLQSVLRAALARNATAPARNTAAPEQRPS